MGPREVCPQGEGASPVDRLGSSGLPVFVLRKRLLPFLLWLLTPRAGVLDWTCARHAAAHFCAATAVWPHSLQAPCAHRLWLGGGVPQSRGGAGPCPG